MVPNKICRSQNFGDAGCLLDHYCEPGFHGGVPGSENQPARCDAQGISDQAQHRNRLGSTGCTVGRVPG